MSTTEPDQMRALAHAMWAGVAPNWERYADDADARGADLARRLADAADLGPGHRVLELACGPGGTGILAASRVGAGGHVVLSDVVSAMVDTAVARAAVVGATNISGAVRDLEAIDEPDGTFDAVLCREGLMFAVDHARAVAEIARVLRPRGRAAVAVWGSRDENPWLGIVLDELGGILGVELPPPGVPGPFDLGDRDALAALFAVGPFTDVNVEPVPVAMGAPSFEVWWSRTTALAGPVAQLIAGLDDAQRAALDTRLRAAVAPYEHEGRIDLPGLSNLLSATRA